MIPSDDDEFDGSVAEVPTPPSTSLQGDPLRDGSLTESVRNGGVGGLGAFDETNSSESDVSVDDNATRASARAMSNAGGNRKTSVSGNIFAPVFDGDDDMVTLHLHGRSPEAGFY